jgi:hypothetical protein
VITNLWDNPSEPAPVNVASASELWRDIPGFPFYQASDLGRVRSCKQGPWRVLRQTRHPHTGYLVVSLRRDGQYFARSVHRLIAAAFLGPANGRDVNHTTGNKRDNRLCNLEYLSRGDNHRHAYRTGLRPPVGLKLTPDAVRSIAALKGTATQRDIAGRFGVCRATVGRIHSGKHRTHVLV